MKLTVGGVNHDDDRDRGIGGNLSGHAQAALLRDFVFFDTVASEHPTGHMTIDLDGLAPKTTYLITWYAYENGPYEVSRCSFTKAA